MLSTLILAQNGPNTQQIVLIVISLIALLLVFIFVIIFIMYFRWWIQSVLTKAGVGFFDLLGMTFRKVKPGVIVPTKIMAVQAGLEDPDITSRAWKLITWLVATCRW